MKKIELSLDTTYSCPFTCSFCSTDYSSKLGSMSVKTARECCLLLESLIDKYHLPSEVVFTGGEPIANSNLQDLIGVFSSVNCKITLCTTGGVRKESGFWTNLSKLGLSRVRLSLHSINILKSKKIFGENYDLSIVKETISNILSSNIELDINYLITNLNKNCFYDVCEFLSNYKIGNIRILGLSNQGRASKYWTYLETSEHEKNIIESNIINACEKFSLNLQYAGFGEKASCTHSDDNGICLGGITFFHINTNGDVFRCPASKSILSNKLGNVTSISSISESSMLSCYSKYEKMVLNT